PNRKGTLTKSLLHENVAYTIYEGIPLTGWPVMTLSRGDIIVKDGVYVGERRRGQFIKREKGCFTGSR
ncbi:MAG TPA: hypothetical protein PLU43_03580, partial [Lachnospiraceae bacterium]|nr:hypothetical protein [Lachnospiraceae bacterium]